MPPPPSSPASARAATQLRMGAQIRDELLRLVLVARSDHDLADPLHGVSLGIAHRAREQRGDLHVIAGGGGLRELLAFGQRLRARSTEHALRPPLPQRIAALGEL